MNQLPFNFNSAPPNNLFDFLGSAQKQKWGHGLGFARQVPSGYYRKKPVGRTSVEAIIRANTGRNIASYYPEYDRVQGPENYHSKVHPDDTVGLWTSTKGGRKRSRRGTRRKSSRRRRKRRNSRH